jgi:hypothetical protein
MLVEYVSIFAHLNIAFIRLSSSISGHLLGCFISIAFHDAIIPLRGRSIWAWSAAHFAASFAALQRGTILPLKLIIPIPEGDI